MTANQAVQNGSVDPLLKAQNERDLDPNIRQRRASDPFTSVWVGASAGTGKTKVLTDRVLRLLLPRSEQEKGTPAHKILCITFTKAGASEMALRINKILAEWAIMPEDKLAGKLKNLNGRDAAAHEIAAARKLFAQVIDTPGGLKIMTIHSFCQSVLGRFPLEAGIRPNFEVLDENTATEIMLQAKDKVYKAALHEKNSDLSRALHNIASTINEDQFLSLLQNMSGEKMQLEKLLGASWNIEGLYTKLCTKLNIQPGLCSADIITEHCQSIDDSVLRDAGRALYESDKPTDNKIGTKFLNWLEYTSEQRIEKFGEYRAAFFTTQNEPRAKLMTNNLAEAYPVLSDLLSQEQQCLIALDETIRKSECAALTRDLFILGQAILGSYDDLKSAQGVLDYDDLINKTSRLLDNQSGHNLANMPGWVMYKLDQGIDHILVDEAQDTNPEQWTIIKSLCEEFFSMLRDKNDITRTVFVVGDDKQSIYSFQRASPEEFEIMRRFFAEKIEQAGHRWNHEDLNISFRSTRSVLEAVDMVFAQGTLENDPGFLHSEHISFRKGQAGLVELWPIFENEETQEIDPWEPPIEIINAKSGSSLCAEKIAETIHTWIGNDKLESHDRAVEAGDIMILVRTRTAFVNQLIRALKIRRIPVSGHDRMVLNEQLAVQDLVSLAEFSLLPDDDLTLACLLKSPLIGIDEDGLYDIAIDRPQSLWDALKAQDKYNKLTHYLQDFIRMAEYARPYEFFAKALSIPCPADDQSGLKAFKSRLGEDCIDPVDELLSMCLRFEEDNIANLQYFLQWHNAGRSEIKRELEESGGQVRIMTIHGSKGLQAPIVILPDTIRISRHVPGQSDKRLLWPNKTGQNLPLWSPRKDMDFDEFREAFSGIEQKADEEYRRLLYVAMTRAEDRLYVTGYKTSKKPMDDCWYYYIQNAMSNDSRVIETADGVLRLSNPQDQDKVHDRKPEEKNNLPEIKDIPHWLFEKAKTEPVPPQPLTPSRPSDPDPATLSPLKSRQQNRFRRGNVTHKLLQFLPDINEAGRQQAAIQFLERYASDFSQTLQNSIVRECMAILNNPVFKPLFGPDSRAEVPITGLLKQKDIVSGQIDRLLITEKQIWIIDFKTNRPPPKDEKDIPAIYRRQMQSYHDILKEIYPAHAIHCGLIWTDGPFLMPVRFD